MSKKQKPAKAKKAKGDLWVGMPRKAHEDLKVFLATLATEVCGLGEWRITLGDEPCEDECMATCDTTENQQHATIRVCRHWNTLDPQLRLEVLMHELMHCHTEQLWRTVDAAKEGLGAFAGGIWEQTVRDQFELTVDNVAFAWAQSVDASHMNHLLYEEPKP
jgi:hypothetical protein